MVLQIPLLRVLPLLISVFKVDEYLDKLRFFFDDGLILAALDIVDRQNGALYIMDLSDSALTFPSHQVQGAVGPCTVRGVRYISCVHNIPR